MIIINCSLCDLEMELDSPNRVVEYVWAGLGEACPKQLLVPDESEPEIAVEGESW